MSPEREPMENDSNSRTAEELEQQTVDVYVERALHGPVFRMSYEHTHTYCEIFYLKSGTCTYTVNQGQWHLEAGDLFIVAAGDPHSTRYEGTTSCERIIVFCKADVLAGMLRGDPTEVQQALERSCKVILNAETRTMVEALLDQMLLENDLPRKYSEQVLDLESLHLVLDSGIDYECRTTWHADVFPLPALYELADDLADCGVANWAVQACRETGRIPHPDDRPDPARLGARFSRFEFRG